MAIIERGQIIVTSAEDLNGPLRSDVVYIIPTVIDMRGFIIDVPAGGLAMAGYNFDTSKLICSEDDYVMFYSLFGGSGNLLLQDMAIEVTGANSKVYELTGATGFEAIEFERVNYNGCTSLGSITNYRQMLESGTGRFGGSPELTFNGSWNGARITTSIVRNLTNGTTLFKEGSGLTFSGRFITDINCDLAATGALFDFQESNFNNDESLVIQGAFVTRSGILDGTDTTIYPNINQRSVKSNWDSNTGMPNTHKYSEASVSVEVLTTIALANTYYPLLGTFTLDEGVQFDMPANGEFRLLTGNGAYNITGDLSIAGTANDVIDVRVTKSSDGGSTWPTEVNHIRRVVNNLAGGRDVAFFPISFIADIKKNERVRLEVENKTAGRNVTMELDSHFIISEV